MINFQFSIFNFQAQEEGGFIALISAIIIAFVLITVTVVLNFVAFYGRFNVLDSEFKETSVALAEACVDVAILEISKGSLPVIGSPISVGSAECTVASIAGSTTKIIKIQAIYKGAYTNLKVSFTPLSQTINSWIECPGTCP